MDKLQKKTLVVNGIIGLVLAAITAVANIIENGGKYVVGAVGMAIFFLGLLYLLIGGMFVLISIGSKDTRKYVLPFLLSGAILMLFGFTFCSAGFYL